MGPAPIRSRREAGPAPYFFSPSFFSVEEHPQPLPQEPPLHVIFQIKKTTAPSTITAVKIVWIFMLLHAPFFFDFK